MYLKMANIISLRVNEFATTFSFGCVQAIEKLVYESNKKEKVGKNNTMNNSIHIEVKVVKLGQNGCPS